MLLILVRQYYAATNDTSCFGTSGAVWLKSVRLIISTLKAGSAHNSLSPLIRVQHAIARLKEQQKGTADEKGNPAYMFERVTTDATETLAKARGQPAKTCGMRSDCSNASDLRDQ